MNELIVCPIVFEWKRVLICSLTRLDSKSAKYILKKNAIFIFRRYRKQ